jgi:hypothetical protein
VEHLFHPLLYKAFQDELSLDEDEALIPEVEVANQQTLFLLILLSWSIETLIN